MLKELPTKDKDKVRELIESFGGKFFRVIFTKRTTGELRTMDCRTGVSKFVKGKKGKGKVYEPKDKDLICVWVPADWDPENNGDTGYRSINLRTVSEIHFAQQVHTFE